MATIDNIHLLREYLTGVLDRANHHAHSVNQIALAIVGGIIWRTTNNIRVLSRQGDMKNVLWLQVDDRRLCFVYNHDTAQIDIRESTIQGNTIVSFDNSTPIADVKDFFENL